MSSCGEVAVWKIGNGTKAIKVCEQHKGLMMMQALACKNCADKLEVERDHEGGLCEVKDD